MNCKYQFVSAPQANLDGAKVCVEKDGDDDHGCLVVTNMAQ